MTSLWPNCRWKIRYESSTQRLSHYSCSATAEFEPAARDLHWSGASKSKSHLRYFSSSCFPAADWSLRRSASAHHFAFPKVSIVSRSALDFSFRAFEWRWFFWRCSFSAACWPQRSLCNSAHKRTSGGLFSWCTACRCRSLHCRRFLFLEKKIIKKSWKSSIFINWNVNLELNNFILAILHHIFTLFTYLGTDYKFASWFRRAAWKLTRPTFLRHNQRPISSSTHLWWRHLPPTHCTSRRCPFWHNMIQLSVGFQCVKMDQDQ